MIYKMLWTGVSSLPLWWFQKVSSHSLFAWLLIS